MNPSSNSSHSPNKQSVMGGKGQGAASNVPKLHVQPGTPLPPPSTRTTPTPQNTLPKVAEEKVNLPQIIPSNHQRALPHANVVETREHIFQQPAPVPRNGQSNYNAHRFNRPIKQDPHNDTGYGPQCVGLGNAHHRAPLGNRQFGHVPLQQHKMGSMVRPTNQQMQGQAVTPTPSDISSIQSTPRNMVTTPMSVCSSDVAMSTSSAGGVDKEHLLMPNAMLKQESWGNYKVLPAVSNCVNGSVVGSENGETVDISQYPSSNNSLSPFPLPDISPLSSSFASPRSSARLAKKRALSVSPLSSEGIDINTLIRLSPTSLFPYINGSRGSSSNTSPQPGIPHGSYGHLTAHSSSGSPNSGGGSAGNRFLNTPQMTGHIYYDMASLEQRSNMANTSPNQMIAHQQNMAYLNEMYRRTPGGHQEQQNMYMDTSFKQEYGDQNHMSGQMPVTSLHNSMPQTSMASSSMPPSAVPNGLPPTSLPGGMPPSSVASSMRGDPPTMEGSMPPPPPYQEAVSQQNFEAQRPPSQSGGGQTSELPELEDGEKPHICKWIDCNQLFNEQDELVRHLEKQHIDQRKGEDFTCFWQGCPRRYKPFNARYKLLIHMRVHSGEKPNKCTFEGCTKAFSRLENLKIHLRSHTGERPYLCTHPGCTKAFSNSSDRAKHQRTHVDTKPYACTVPGCSKRYTDPSSLRKHTKHHTSNEQQARKKMRPGKDGDYSSSDILNTCLSIQGVNNSPMDATDSRSPRSDMYPGMQFGNHSAVASPGSMHGSPGMPPAGLGAVEEYDRRITVGGGFHPTPNGALIAPRRVAPSVGQRGLLPNLQVTKLGTVGIGMVSAPPPPPPYQQQDTGYQPQTPVATPGPVEGQQTLGQDTSVQSSMSESMNMTTSYQPPRSVDGPSILATMGLPPTSSSHLPHPNPHPQRLHAFNYMPQAGNVPLANDYASMPCNLQERMMVGVPNMHQFHLTTIPTLEETLANLPYDAVQLQRALSNHSGISDLPQLSPRDVDALSANLASDDNQYLQLNAVDRCNSRLSAVSVYGDGSTC